MYITRPELMDRFDATELAQVVPPQSMGRVDGALMRAVILGEPTDDWPGDEIAAAEAGLLRMDEAIADATAEIDSYIGQRYSLPLATVPGVLKRYAGTIARYHLHDDSEHEHVRQRYQDTLKALGRIASGELDLGLPQPPASKSGTAEIVSAPARWRRETSGGYL